MVGMDLGEACSVCRLLLFLAQIQGFALLRESQKQPMHLCVRRNGPFPEWVHPQPQPITPKPPTPATTVGAY